MDYLHDVLARLATVESCGYHPGSEYASEPTALAAMALLAHGRQSAALPMLDWLLRRQGADGSVGIDAAHATPGWPTGWAVAAWQAAQHCDLANAKFAAAIAQAHRWLFRVQGDLIEHHDELGHDTTIKGWPWVEGTHAWVEPTSMNLLALKHTGMNDQPRAREAVRLLIDRLLPQGGANYGNTVVFGQELRPHLQATGLCLLALAGETDRTVGIERAINYLLGELSAETTTSSLCYALLGLAAHHRLPADYRPWLAAASRRTLARDAGGYKLALLALASLGDACPLIPRPRDRDAMTTETLPNLKPAAPHEHSFDRRKMLIATGAALTGLVTLPLVKNALALRASVFVADNQRYDGPLQQTIREGLIATGLKPAGLRGKRVLLKPNLVEPTRNSPQMTTHPAVVVAAAEVFRGWGAEVIVGEGPGHMRDTEMALVESGMQAALDDSRLDFADLNYSRVDWLKNGGRFSKLDGFYFPEHVLEADLIVSLPKMKTHHWVGYTAALKNLYGVIPGIKYGWPKNVLHHAGIPQTIFDINASLPKTVAIVDGIVAMEGDGPIMGGPKPMGLLVIGTNSTAVDATVGRIMGFDPSRVEYLQLAANRLGPVQERYIEQRGVAWQSVASPFTIIDFPHLKQLRAPGILIT